MNNKYSGSTFDSFLEEEGLREDVENVAVKRVLAWQFEQAMLEQQKTKKEMAEALHTSRSQLDRLLDPKKLSVTVGTIEKAAKVLNKKVILRIEDIDESNVGSDIHSFVADNIAGGHRYSGLSCGTSIRWKPAVIRGFGVSRAFGIENTVLTSKAGAAPDWDPVKSNCAFKSLEQALSA